MSAEGFETISQMKLHHLPNDAKLVIQRQRGAMIPDGTIQFGLPTTFVNSENNQTVWNRGQSIQIQQIPELIEMLSKVYEKYSRKNIPYSTKRTVTFADFIDD